MTKKIKGFTLLEIIISIAILGILAAALLPVFVSGFKWIVSAGHKSDQIFQSQNEAEDKILEGAASMTSTMSIVFTGLTVTLTGEDVTKDDIHVFIPK